MTSFQRAQQDQQLSQNNVDMSQLLTPKRHKTMFLLDHNSNFTISEVSESISQDSKTEKSYS